ncbi:non-ribosomal peptide synthetase [Sporomusa sphaeroides]|uniref:non-ribosomal peptide synthetase n=1 Tax=Sporomusa sphaeroides TaxID=47679 RepID=UPI003DA04C36
MLRTGLLNDKEMHFIKLFQNQLKKNSNKSALVFEGAELTYGQLDSYSNRISHLINHAYNKEKMIALLLSNPVSQICAMLGALKSGLCFIPLDPAYPVETIENIINDSGAKVILTEAEQLPIIRKSGNPHMTVLDIDDAESYSLDPIKLPLSQDDYSYIFYTSGSMGKPKGVVHDHRNLLHLIAIYSSDLQIEECDRFSYLYSYSFSAGLKDVFAALACGATLFPYVIKNKGIKRLVDHLRENRISIYHSVPTVFRHLCSEFSEENCLLPDLRIVSLGSEAVTPKDFELYSKHFSDHCRMHIEYGITEAGVISQYFLDKSTHLQTRMIPVGYPVYGKEINLVDEQEKSVKPYEVGEIIVNSPYIAKGYWEKGELLPFPIKHSNNEFEIRVFKTGDLGIRYSDGCLEHLGRKDNQIKILGHKVNIRELENYLNGMELISEAVVIPKKNKLEDSSLVGFIVFKNSTEPNPLAIVKEELWRKFPEYMIPSHLIEVEQIPKLPNGKRDQQKLLSVIEKYYEAGKQNYSDNIIEQAISLIYADILDTRNFGVNDNIFELGGDSMAASKVCSIIEDLFQIDFPVSYIFASPSVAALSQCIMTSCKSAEQLTNAARRVIDIVDTHTN